MGSHDCMLILLKHTATDQAPPTLQQGGGTHIGLTSRAHIFGPSTRPRPRYNESSAIWESVWGEHMHTGYYDDYDDTTVFTRQDHLDAQTRMMKELLGKWDYLLRVARAAQEEQRPLRILDVGCGVGGSSR